MKKNLRELLREIFYLYWLQFSSISVMFEIKNKIPKKRRVTKFFINHRILIATWNSAKKLVWNSYFYEGKSKEPSR